MIDPTGLYAGTFQDQQLVQAINATLLVLGTAIIINMVTHNGDVLTRPINWAKEKKNLRRNWDATLLLPISLIDTKIQYDSAANSGVLIKTAVFRTRKHIKVWENAFGPVPLGFNVDHIIMLQFNGPELLLSNLRLRVSALNRREGSLAFWLNAF